MAKTKRTKRNFEAETLMKIMGTLAKNGKTDAILVIADGYKYVSDKKWATKEDLAKAEPVTEAQVRALAEADKAVMLGFAGKDSLPVFKSVSIAEIQGNTYKLVCVNQKDETSPKTRTAFNAKTICKGNNELVQLIN